jgi:hypothetical protein
MRALLTPNMAGNDGVVRQIAVEDGYEAAYKGSLMGIFRRPSQTGNVLTSNLAAHRPLCLTMLLCLAASGCVTMEARDSAPRMRAAAVPPDEKKLAELANTAFTTAKLSGAAEVSPVRAAHDTQLGDWVFCIRGRGAEQMPEYAVLIRDNTILDIRSLVSIDGCYGETYRPIEIKAQQGAAGTTKVNPSTPSPRRHQTKVTQ